MAAFKPGDMVRVASALERIGSIVAVEAVHAGIQYYRVLIQERPKTMPENDLVPYIEGGDILTSLIGGQLGRIEDFQRLMTFNRLFRDRPLLNHIYAFNASRTRFYPHQFKPLIKFLGSPNSRILIADEVGLGKTIEAGLILTELEARQDVSRVLIVCPANLTAKWRLEMRNRFGQNFTVYRAREFREFLTEFETAPIKPDMRVVISLESIRAESVSSALAEIRPDLDLVIVDEAHHMRNFGRLQRRAGVVLSELARAMVLLTATPIQLGQQDLFSLLNLLEPDEFRDRESAMGLFKMNEPIVRAQNMVSRIPPMVEEARREITWAAAAMDQVRSHPDLPFLMQDLDEIESQPRETRSSALVSAQRRLTNLNLLSHIYTRTKKRDVFADAAKRKAHSWRVEFTDKEREFYDAVTALVRAEATARTQNPVVRQWMLNTPQRRVASSIPAMVRYYKTYAGADLGEDSEDNYFVDGDAEAPLSTDRAQRQLKSIVANWKDDEKDSKYDAFKTILENGRVERGSLKVLVFAFFKDTLYYLKERLARDGFGVVMISGDDKPDDRSAIILGYRMDTNAEVLLSSRVGSEGLDFQFCSTVINYDLPWNPMEIEQRIGRVDRLGQEAEIIDIHNLTVEGTIEQRILTKLFERIGIFERNVGDIEAILGDEWRALEWDLLAVARTPEEEGQRIDQAWRVFEARMQAMEELDDKTAEFVGTDAFFEHEIAEIEDKYRYVTGKQLFDYVERFLETRCPRTRLNYNWEEEVGIIKPDAELCQFISRRGLNAALRNFLTSPATGIKLTFDRRRAFEDPQMEFVNVTHPLVQAITEDYRESTQTFTTSHHVALRTEVLPPGHYIFFIWRLLIRAARDYNSLEMVALGGPTDSVISGSEAERLMGQILEAGTSPVNDQVNVNEGSVRAAYQRAEAVFRERARVIREEKEQTNTGYVERRVASLDAHYSKNIGSIRQQLDDAERRDLNANYKRMMRGKLTKVEAERQAKISEIYATMNVSEEVDGLASGFLQVLAP